MNANTHDPARSVPAARRLREPGSPRFDSQRRLDRACLTPGFYLMRLREARVTGHAVWPRRRFVTES